MPRLIYRRKRAGFGRILLLALSIALPAPALDLPDYRERLASGDPTLGGDLRRAQYRITNRETAYVVARHHVVLDGDPRGAEGLLPEAGLTDDEENLLGFTRQMSGAGEDALFHYQRAFAQSEGRMKVAFLNQALLLLEQGAYFEARRWVLENEKYLTGNPDFALVKSVALFAMEDFAGADRWLTRSSLFGPLPTAQRAAYFRMRGLFLEGRGSNALALVSWRQAAAIDPGFELSRLKVGLLTEQLHPRRVWIDDETKLVQKRAQNAGEPGETENFLTDRQLRDRLAAIEKLVTQREAIVNPGRDFLREAWERLSELSRQNAALYGRDQWYWRAVIAHELGRPELAHQCIERAKGCPRSPILGVERLAILEPKVEAARLAGAREREARARLRMDLDPRRQVVAVLLAEYPAARRVPIPESYSNAFFLDLGRAVAPAAPVPVSTNRLPVPNLRRHLRGEKTAGSETYVWDEELRPSRIEWRDGAGELLGVRIYEYTDVERCWRLDARGRTNGLTETRRGRTNAETWMERLDWQDGRLVEVVKQRGGSETVHLPDVTLLRESETRVEGRLRFETVRAGGVLLWEETTRFEREDQMEGTEVNRERRGPDGSLVETRRWERRGGQAWKEWRLAPDGRVLEWWQWE
jgi:tetratricopeptide (TPR) repeat protein